MGVGLKEKRSKERNLGFSLCRSPPEGPEGTFRGKVGMEVGSKEERFKERNLGFSPWHSPNRFPQGTYSSIP